MRPRPLAGLVGLVVLAALVVTPAPPAAALHGGDTLVSVGSPPGPFAQNKQNEPAVAIDPANPNAVVAGANDEIDIEACNAGDPTTCPFTVGVGTSGVYFSFDSGDTWTQPTYAGFSARNCLGDPDPSVTTDVCVPDENGPIGTLPGYFENGLVSDGDPALAFGPVPGSDGTFSWDNGSRLYYANLTANFSSEHKETAFKGDEAIGVSRTDDVAAAAAGEATAWMDPVIASKQSSASFGDKEQIWADNAESSPFFGNVYVCYNAFTGFGAAPQVVSRSTDGGDTWDTKQVSPAHNASPSHFGQSGCTVRTDSNGVVYDFWEQFQSPERFLPTHGTLFLVKSSDGGVSWTRPMELFSITDPCFHIQFDGTNDRCVMDGIGGARDDLASSPNVSLANGAPGGDSATNEIVMTFVDASDGENSEHVMVTYSTDGGDTWAAPTSIETPGDRGYYTAPAISPSGTDVYVVYNAFTTPFRDNTTGPRGLIGVVLHADVGAGGTPTNWTVLNRGAEGDPRGSSQNNQFLEFLGDYVYAAATDNYGVAVWNDVRHAADCPAEDAWRATAQSTLSIAGRPAPGTDCPATFGNSDIFGGSYADPTP